MLLSAFFSLDRGGGGRGSCTLLLSYIKTEFLNFSVEEKTSTMWSSIFLWQEVLQMTIGILVIGMFRHPSIKLSWKDTWSKWFPLDRLTISHFRVITVQQKYFKGQLGWETSELKHMHICERFTMLIWSSWMHSSIAYSCVNCCGNYDVSANFGFLSCSLFRVYVHMLAVFCW